MQLIGGIVLLALGIGLVVIALPNRSGTQKAFMQPDAMMVFYPPLCLAVITFGVALVVSSLVGA